MRRNAVRLLMAVLFALVGCRRPRRTFGPRDLAALARDAQVAPGADAGTPLIAVSRSGFAVDGLAAAYGPEQLIESWRPRG